MSRYAAALDFGSSKVALAVGERLPAGIRIVSYHDAESTGIECGEIVNDFKVEETVRALIAQAAEELHDKIKYEQWRIDRIGEKPKRTWDEACIRWLDEKGAKKSIYDDKLKMKNLPQLRGMFLEDITRDFVQKIIAQKTCSEATKNRYTALVRAILNRAMREWEWIDNVPYFSMYPEPKKRIRWLTPEQAKRLIDAAPPYLAQMIKFSLATGLRQRNVMTLKWQQVDLDRRVAWYYDDE